jgi:hypothetical protein
MSIQAIVQEAWAGHEALRRLGFPSDDIYIVFGVCAPAGTMYQGEECVAVLVKQGTLDFVFTIAPVRDVALFAKRWKKFIEDVNAKAFPASQIAMAYEESFVARHFDEMITAIKAKGLSIPKEAS